MEFWEHKLIKLARHGVVIRARAMDMTGKDATLPFTMDMTEEAVRTMWNSGSQDHNLLIMGIYMQTVTVLRISKMVLTAEDHYIEAGSVEFECEIDGRTKQVKTQEAYVHNVSCLRSVSFEIKSKKTIRTERVSGTITTHKRKAQRGLT